MYILVHTYILDKKKMVMRECQFMVSFVFIFFQLAWLPSSSGIYECEYVGGCDKRMDLFLTRMPIKISSHGVVIIKKKKF